MEPLVAFFLFLGIIFGIIGTYLILTIIREIAVKWTPELKSMLTGNIDALQGSLHISQQILDKIDNGKVISSSTKGELHDKIKYLKQFHADFSNAVDKEKLTEQKEYVFRRSWQAGSFLIGGFALDFLGVLTQLTYT